MKILPPPVFLLCLITSTALHFYWPLLVLLEAPYTYSGLVPVCLGALLLAAGSSRFLKIGTNLNTFIRPDTLVTSGPFRITRNPMYLGFLLVLIGNWLLWGTATAIVGPLLFFCAAQFIYIPFEENKCKATFGEDYLVYKNRVRRWF